MHYIHLIKSDLFGEHKIPKAIKYKFCQDSTCIDLLIFHVNHIKIIAFHIK